MRSSGSKPSCRLTDRAGRIPENRHILHLRNEYSDGNIDFSVVTWMSGTLPIERLRSTAIYRSGSVTDLPV
jgi:hypothetical protein